MYLDEEGSTWPPRTTAPGDPVILGVQPADLVDTVAARAIALAGRRIRDLYYFDEEGPFFSPVSLKDAAQRPAELVSFPQFVPDEGGELLWTAGARARVRLADLQRAKEQGFFQGDPLGIFLERPMYGEAPPGWLELISWLSDIGGVLGLAALLGGVVKSGWEHWKERGAVTPFAFLDLVVTRSQWRQNDLERLLRLSSDQAADLLTSFGYERAPDDEHVWMLSKEPEKSALRRRIIEDYLHRTNDDPYTDRG